MCDRLWQHEPYGKLYPELSSVDNSVEAACVAAVSMLIHKLKNHRIPSELTVSSAVVYRKTTR